MRSLKIVHCGIFNEYDDGDFFYGLERKISHGLIRGGHFVYDFSYRDWERNLRLCGIKNSGLKKMNDKLARICKNINADLLLIAKGEKIELSTLKAIKQALPKIKIALWYVDHLEEKSAFFEKLDFIDVFFWANGLKLRELSTKFSAKFAFFPNISDAAFDKKLNLTKTTDVIYIARDYKEDVRFKFALLLRDFCQKENLNLKIFASLDNPSVFGDEFHRELAKTKIAVNFNRDDELESMRSQKLLGASDRMAQFMGCGICTFSPAIAGFEKLYEDKKDIVYFINPSDCFAKIKEYLSCDKYAQIAAQGRVKTLKIANATRVGKFMLETIFEESFGNENCDEKDTRIYNDKDGKICEKHAASGEKKNRAEKDDENFINETSKKQSEFEDEADGFYSENYEWREFIYRNGERV
ncbi:MAG: glycosyltransferase [Campylobacter sp.]|nr:glycosyltransferase [Campylobacter sp.]